MEQHYSASAVIIDRWSSSVLLILHDGTGKWQFPGGHIDTLAGGEMEAPHVTARREAKEETGLEVTFPGCTKRWVYPPTAGITEIPSPFMTFAIPVDAKPARPGKPAQEPHVHVDLLFITEARRGYDTVKVQLDEVRAAQWFRVEHLEWVTDVREEVPAVALAAWNELLRTD